MSLLRSQQVAKITPFYSNFAAYVDCVHMHIYCLKTNFYAFCKCKIYVCVYV